jgi:hypothetical protein
MAPGGEGIARSRTRVRRTLEGSRRLPTRLDSLAGRCTQERQGRLFVGSQKDTAMVTRIPWTKENDAQLRRLAERGYTITRASVVMKRSTNYLVARAKSLDIRFRNPLRLSYNERSYAPIARASGQFQRNRRD